MYRTVGKRFFDVLGSTLLICLLSPIFLILLVAGFLFNRGNPFFVQPRVGRYETVFQVIKFRTMNQNCDEFGNLLPDSDRLTAYGRVLRRTSLDEIPQLLNILRGEMSFIGPRPLLVRYLPYYSEMERKRHNVIPGITGLAQVKGRNDLGWAARFEYDVEYVTGISLFGDLKILAMTLSSVVSASGVKADVTTTGLRDLNDERRT